MATYIDTTDLADDICAKLPPLKSNNAMIDAAKGVVDVILEQVESVVADAIAKATERVASEAPDIKMSDLTDLSDDCGREIGAVLSEADHLSRITFFRGLLDSLDRTALDDLQAEIVRR